ncbi:MAG: efflux RND transporter permease subunit [Burkholderiales bacterium]|nr:efflux RND transporter permease subunit [Burkholderiales bacterium]
MFNLLLAASLKNRLMTLAAALVLLIYGGLTLVRTPVDVFPDLNRPTVTLISEAGGMAPEEIEQLVTIPLEAAMSGMPGVISVRSTSSAGLAFIYVAFDWTTDIYRARQLVSERLSLVREQLPQGIFTAMGPVASIMGEIMQIALPFEDDGGATGVAGAPGTIGASGAMRVREYADWVLRPRLLNIPGVAQVIPIGGAVRQFQVQPNTARMAELDVTLDQVETALRNFSANSSGGFLEVNGREYLIRTLARTASLTDLASISVAPHDARSKTQPILLRQVATVAFAPAIKRGDAGYNGRPAVILGVQKQPDADTVRLTRSIEAALDELKAGLPAGLAPPQVTFRQASFIEGSVENLKGKLMMASVVVAAVLLLFLGNWRVTLISLTAIPLSFLSAALVFKFLGLSINTMTLGGLAIAVGALVDDAIVGLENTLRRLRQGGAHDAGDALKVIAEATAEVRSGIVTATVIICLVFVPLFALPGIEGRLFTPLGVAYLTSILASLVVSITVSPVLAYYLIPRSAAGHDEGRVLAFLKRHYRSSLSWVLERPRVAVSAAVAGALAAAALVPLFPTTFLPPFSEGSALVGLRLNPGVTLGESVRLARLAEKAVAGVAEVEHVGRRSGRAELDEHAEGVHVSELDLKLKRLGRPLDAVYADIRARLADLPVALNIGQPISHRIDHMLSGVRSQMAIRIFGEDLDTLRAESERLRDALSRIPGIADLEIEKQVLSPQIKIRVDYARAQAYGLSPAVLTQELQALIEGERLGQIIEGNRRFALVLRLPESQRGLDGLTGLLIETPTGRVPLSKIAAIEDADGPNQVSRDNGKRRIVLSANAQGRALSDVVADVGAVIRAAKPPEGYFITFEGQFQAQQEAARLIGLLSLASLALVVLVLYSRYGSMTLSAAILANVPLALIGSVGALWLSGQPLSIASLIGFITLAGVAVRNGILKVSHYVNLCRFEGEVFGDALILRGSAERLSPVLMTALVAAFALAPLLLDAEAPGAEILYPVAVVIFGGLITSTLLDSYVTPALFKLVGARPLAALLARDAKEVF